MANELVRNELRKSGLRQWELAGILGISEQTIYRKLRKELPANEQKQLISVIHANKKEG